MTTSKNAQDAGNAVSEVPSKRKKCKYTGCRKLFVPNRPWQDFCKPSCKDQFHNFGDAYGTLTKRGTDRLMKETLAKLESQLPKLAKKLFRDIDKKQTAMQSELDRMAAELELLKAR